MIYANVIREQQFEKLFKSPLELLQEYYESEISFLNATIHYKNECAICESSELEVLQEGFIETFKEKLKVVIDKFMQLLQDSWKFITVVVKKAIAVLKKKYQEAVNTLKKNINSGDIRKLARGCSVRLKITDKAYIITRYKSNFMETLFGSPIFKKELQQLDGVLQLFMNAVVSDGKNADVKFLSDYKKNNEQLLQNIRILVQNDKITIKTKIKDNVEDIKYNDEETLKDAIRGFYKMDEHTIKELEMMHNNFLNFAIHVKSGVTKIKDTLNKVKNWKDIESLNLLYSIVNSEINKCSMVYTHGAYLCNVGIKLLQYRDHSIKEE